MKDELVYILNRPLRHGLMTSLGITLSYGLACVIGCCGNIGVVVAVQSTHSLRTRTNFFIVNLAIADLLVNILCVPSSLWLNLFDEFVFGELMCKLVSFCQGVSSTASVYTLIAISLERCIVVACPFSAMVSLRKCLLSIWALAVIVNLPWLMVYRVQMEFTEHSGRVEVCLEEWPSRQAEAVYFAFACLAIGYLCPLFAIATCNFVIWRTVINRQTIGEDVFSQQRAEIHRTKLKVTKMVLVVVITFFLSWLPLYAILCFVKFQPDDEVASVTVGNFLDVAAPFAQFLAAFNSSINPILYAFMNKKFRQGFKAIFCKSTEPTPNTNSPVYDISLETLSTHIVR